MCRVTNALEMPQWSAASVKLLALTTATKVASAFKSRIGACL
jgi:hypothetical protein